MVATIKFRPYRRFDARIWIITAIGLLNVAGFSLSLPFLSLYLYQERGVPMIVVGMIILFSIRSRGGISAMGQHKQADVSKDILTKSCIVFVPEGIKHCTLIIRMVDRPIFGFTTSPAAAWTKH